MSNGGSKLIGGVHVILTYWPWNWNYPWNHKYWAKAVMSKWRRDAYGTSGCWVQHQYGQLKYLSLVITRHWVMFGGLVVGASDAMIAMVTCVKSHSQIRLCCHGYYWVSVFSGCMIFRGLALRCKSRVWLIRYICLKQIVGLKGSSSGQERRIL